MVTPQDLLSVFPDAHFNSGYVRVRCPYHKDGQERKPSMSILLEPRGGAPAGFCHCFACGKKIMLAEMLKDLNANIVGDLAITASSNDTEVTLTTDRPMLKAQLPFKKSAYLESRGIGEAVQKKFKIYEDAGKVHMPVFSRDGFFLYDNARSTVGKRFFVESHAKKTLWGIEEIDLSKPVCICESQINAMSFWQVGVQAVATLGADNVDCLIPLKQCTSTIVLAFDPDLAGFTARDRAVQMFGAFRCKWLDLPEGIDVNQALQDIKDEHIFKDFMFRCMRPFVQYITN